MGVISFSGPFTNEAVIRTIAGDDRFTSEEMFPGQDNGHKFKPGESALLVGLTSFPEYNGQTVEITSIREDGSDGKAYYVKGQINEMLNWLYESRLQKIEPTNG